MQSILRLGRIGPLNISLHYTWLLVATLELWWVGLLWLPANFPDNGSLFYWSIAVGVLLLFFLSVIVHELIHSRVAGTGRRYAVLFPFGAAMPFGTQRTEAGRAIIAALAAPSFNILVGVLLLTLGGAAPDTGLAAIVKALFIPLGVLNLALGLINFIPGTPFDGGWAVMAVGAWFSGSFDTRSKIVYIIGQIAALVFVLAGAWLGLTTDRWLEALSLVLIGWTAREAANFGRQRSMMRSALQQLTAANFMDASDPSAVVHSTDSIADMVGAFGHYPPHRTLPVINKSGAMVGTITLDRADTLLQGQWPSTPVTSLMIPLQQVRAAHPNSPLTEVFNLFQTRPHSHGDEQSLPVIEDGVLVGTIDRARLEAFAEVGQVFGVEETFLERDVTPGKLSTLAMAVPVVLLLATLAVLGNMALRTNPAEPIAITPSAQVKFSALTPSESAIVGLNTHEISMQATAASPIVSATIILDGQPVTTKITGEAPLVKILTAQIPNLQLGSHSVRGAVTTQRGMARSPEWQFRVSSTAPDVEEADATATGLGVVSVQPPLDGRVLAGGDVPLNLLVKDVAPPEKAQISVDGHVIDSRIAPVDGADGNYTIAASLPNMPAGNHQVRVDIQTATGNVYTSQWYFSATQPDASNVYFKETGYFVAEPFLKYWNEHGGLAVFGYPISYRVQETVKGTGETYTAQYFERARFELHPATGDQVVLGRLGAITHPAEPADQPAQGAQFFKETGHNVSGAFLKYWQEHGGLAQFGFPISEEKTEKNAIDGKEYSVQYFERNRFELHPEKAGTPFEVQLGQLGTQLYKQIYGPQPNADKSISMP